MLHQTPQAMRLMEAETSHRESRWRTATSTMFAFAPKTFCLNEYFSVKALDFAMSARR